MSFVDDSDQIGTALRGLLTDLRSESKPVADLAVLTARLLLEVNSGTDILPSNEALYAQYISLELMSGPLTPPDIESIYDALLAKLARALRRADAESRSNLIWALTQGPPVQDFPFCLRALSDLPLTAAETAPVLRTIGDMLQTIEDDSDQGVLRDLVSSNESSLRAALDSALDRHQEDKQLVEDIGRLRFALDITFMPATLRLPVRLTSFLNMRSPGVPWVELRALLDERGWTPDQVTMVALEDSEDQTGWYAVLVSPDHEAIESVAGSYVSQARPVWKPVSDEDVRRLTSMIAAALTVHRDRSLHACAVTGQSD